MKRTISFICAFCMVMVLAIPASAEGYTNILDADTPSEAAISEYTVSEAVYIPDDPSAPIQTTVSGEEAAALSASSNHYHILPEDYSGKGDYDNAFSCDPNDGNRLNIWVRNNGDVTVIVNISFSKPSASEDYPAIYLAPGDQITKKYSYDDNRGIDGDWSINVTTELGGTMDISVSARQYQINS